MSRTGMSNLLGRLRRLIDDSGTAVWSDDQLQNIADEHKLRLDQEPLAFEQTLTSGTTYEYKIYHSRYGNLEEGTALFRVHDSSGSARSTADYTADYVRGMITMGSDQVGTALFLTGWTYDLYGAAADCWRERMGVVASRYNVSADGHSLSRAQWFDHCERMAEYYDRMARPVTVRPWQSGVLDSE